MVVGKGSKARLLVDGGGLCSPGLWAPWNRPKVMDPVIVSVRAALRRAITDLPKLTEIHNAALLSAAKGELKDSPFPEEMMAALRAPV